MKKLLLPLLVIMAPPAIGAEPNTLVRYSNLSAHDESDSSSRIIAACLPNKLKQITDATIDKENPDFYISTDVVRQDGGYFVLWSVADAFRSTYWSAALPANRRAAFLAESRGFRYSKPRISGWVLVKTDQEGWCSSLVLDINSEVFKPFLAGTFGR